MESGTSRLWERGTGENIFPDKTGQNYQKKITTLETDYTDKQKIQKYVCKKKYWTATEKQGRFNMQLLLPIPNQMLTRDVGINSLHDAGGG